MIVFTDKICSGSLSTSKIVTKRYILYVGRVLHRPQSEIIIVRKLMQGSVNDFSIFIVKNIPQDKIIHELEPKKWVFGFGGWTKHNIDF